MKQTRLFACLLALFVASFAQAQTQKGNSRIGADLTFLNSDSDQDTRNNQQRTFGVNAGYSYFLKDNLALGLGFGFENRYNSFTTQYDNSNGSYESTNSTNSNEYSVRLVLDNYIPLSDKLSAVFNSRLGYSIGSNISDRITTNPGSVEDPDNPWTQETTSKTTSIAINPGFIYFVRPKLGLQANMGGITLATGSSVNETLDSDPRTWSSVLFRLNDFSAFSFGVTYFL